MSSTPDDGRKCAHPDCQCIVDDKNSFCSEYCKIAGEEEYCGCGHGVCNTTFENRAKAQEAAA